MEKKTKIICTLGPSTIKQEIIEKMIKTGMNLARFNFSHGTYEEHKKKIYLIREVEEKIDKPIGLILDNKGPEVRLGSFEKGKAELTKGNKFILTNEEIVGNKEKTYQTYNNLHNEVSENEIILLADGLIELKVLTVKNKEVITEILNSGIISNRKRVAVPGVRLKLPPLSQMDIEDLLFGAEQKMDFIAASFTQSANDICLIRSELNKVGSKMLIIAKIENMAGVNNIKEIVKEADAIMVARGDLGVEIPPENVPILQKMIVSEANAGGKPVIIATQMLESMITNPRPTRAETSDVANAILDGADAVMLSAETANGKYPVESVEIMTRIVTKTESALKYNEMLMARGISNYELAVTTAISHASVQVAQEIGAKAIISPTETGSTPLIISKYRPKAPIVAITPHKEQLRKMTLIWGVYPFIGLNWKYTDQIISNVISIAISKKFCKNGDNIVVTAGIPVGKVGTTNMISVRKVRYNIFKGAGIGDKKMYTGISCICKKEEDIQNKLKNGEILIIKTLSMKNSRYTAVAGAIITDKSIKNDVVLEIWGKYKIPLILLSKEDINLILDKLMITVFIENGQIFQDKPYQISNNIHTNKQNKID